MRAARELRRARSTWLNPLRPYTTAPPLEWQLNKRLFFVSSDPALTQGGTTRFIPCYATRNDIDVLEMNLKKFGFEIIPQKPFLSARIASLFNFNDYQSELPDIIIKEEENDQLER